MYSVFVIWVFFGIATAIVAPQKHRSGCGWFLVGFFLGPFGLLFALLVGKQPKQSGTNLTECHACGNNVSVEAASCPKCGQPMNLR